MHCQEQWSKSIFVLNIVFFLMQVVALWQGGSIKEFTNITSFLTSRVGAEQNLMVMTSAEEGLSLEPEEVIICSSSYDIPGMPLSRISICSFNGMSNMTGLMGALDHG